MRTGILAFALFLSFVIVAGAANLITEGFEGGVVPPAGWTLETTAASYTWVIEDTPAYVNSGTYSAICPHNSSETQDEWLITPVMDLTGGSATLDFYWYGSTKFANNANLYVKGSTDGTNYTDIWEIPYEGSGTGSHIWTNQVLTLGAFQNNPTVYIAFVYAGVNGDSAIIDDIIINDADAIKSDSLGSIKAAFK